MESMVGGDMAKESLHLAEDRYLNDPDSEPYVEENEYKGDDPCKPSYKMVNGILHEVYVGGENIACWNKGDYYYNSKGEFVKAPDSWHLDDMRQSETIYRPIRK